MNVPREKFDHLNYSLDVDYMQTPAKYGGGVEALVEVFHQLHCLVRTKYSPASFPISHLNHRTSALDESYISASSEKPALPSRPQHSSSQLMPP